MYSRFSPAIRLLGFSVTTAHHLDIGALVPGSCGIVDAVDAYAEGLQFKAIKVYERGVPNRQFWNFLKDNIRASEMVLGDIEAQISACRTGEQRLLEVVRGVWHRPASGRQRAT